MIEEGISVENNNECYRYLGHLEGRLDAIRIISKHLGNLSVGPVLSGAIAEIANLPLRLIELQSIKGQDKEFIKALRKAAKIT